MAPLLAVLMALVAAYSGARILAPASGGTGAARVAGHPRDIQAWHGVMGASMAAMLVTSLRGGAARAALAVFAVCVAWCGVRLVRRTSWGVSTRGAYLRLGVCGVAMLAMLTPQAALAASVAGHPVHGPVHGSVHALAGTGPASPPLAAVVLILALGCVVAAGTARLALAGRIGEPGARLRHRLEAACEVAMATAMVYMLAVTG